ncbi:hypothetical protein GCM10022223_44340 [Kineosporia mesophila]|uniref:Uncharacterized protein n=1 Tax=Kineosporia mesophila TaxID=566012 RepID=A0ABP7A0Q1_9ACTN
MGPSMSQLLHIFRRPRSRREVTHDKPRSTSPPPAGPFVDPEELSDQDTIVIHSGLPPSLIEQRQFGATLPLYLLRKRARSMDARSSGPT